MKLMLGNEDPLHDAARARLARWELEKQKEKEDQPEGAE